MIYYTYFHSRISLYQNKLNILNIFSLYLISNLLFKLEIKYLDNLQKAIIWKSFYVLSFFIGANPKFLFIKINRPHKDVFFNCLIFFYIHKKKLNLWFFNIVRLLEDNVSMHVYCKNLSFLFNSFRFVRFYDTKTELFKWDQSISVNLINFISNEDFKLSVLNFDLIYKDVL